MVVVVADDTSLGVAGSGDRQGTFLRQIPVAGRHFKQRNALFVVWGTLQREAKRHFWACTAENAFAQPGFAVIPSYVHPITPYRGAKQSVLHLGVTFLICTPKVGHNYEVNEKE